MDSAEHRDKQNDCCTLSCGRLTFLVTMLKSERQKKVEKRLKCWEFGPSATHGFVFLRPESQSKNVQLLSNITNHSSRVMFLLFHLLMSLWLFFPQLQYYFHLLEKTGRVIHRIMNSSLPCMHLFFFFFFCHLYKH